MQARTYEQKESKAAEKTGIVKRLLNVHEYHRMGEAGILHKDDRVELIGGELAEMSPISGRHAKCVTELLRVLIALIAPNMRVSPQNPVRLDEHNEPEPDVAVIRAGERHEAGELPIPEDVLFLVEVSDSTLRYDRNTKLPLYARFGIPEVWILDLNGNVAERHTEPSEGGYKLVRRFGKGDTADSAVAEGVKFAVSEVLD